MTEIKFVNEVHIEKNGQIVITTRVTEVKEIKGE